MDAMLNVTEAFTAEGFDAFATYDSFIGGVYFSLYGFWVVTIAVAVLFLGKVAFRLVRPSANPWSSPLPAPAAKPPFPSSSKASRTSEKWTRAIGFVLPVGYSFNVDGSMPYMTFASVFLLLNIGPKYRQIHGRLHTNAQLLQKTPYHRTPRRTVDG